VQEHVFQRGPAHQRREGLKTALADARKHFVPVLDIQQDAIGSRDHPFGAQIFDFLGRLLTQLGREPQLKDLGGRVGLDELARGAGGDDLRVVHDDEAVAQLLGLVHVVRGEDERDAALLEPVQPVPHHVPGLRVQAGGWLVEDEDVRVVDQRPGDRETAFHPARQRVDLVIPAVRQLDEIQQLVGALADELLRQAEVPAVDQQVLPDRELEVQGVLLRHDAEPPADRRPIAHGIPAEDGKLPICRR
jgi:hypothetical protein